MGKRYLGAIRLSEYGGQDDPTTSPVRQRQAIQDWADREPDAAIVDWAEDLDVSASKVGPFARPALGERLTYRYDEWDGVVFWRQDRAVRSMNDMSDLTRWATERGKDLVFITGAGGQPFILNMSSGPVAEFIAMAFAFAAQMESLAGMQRVTEARAYMRTVGRYGGGWVKFPYMATERTEGNGWQLVPDPTYVPAALLMVDMVLDGKGPSAVADELNARGIATSKDADRLRRGKETKGHKWTYIGVVQVLRSRSLCGITEVFPDWKKERSIWRGDEREIVRGDDGLPIRFAEPIISDDTWRRVQDKLDALSHTNKLPRRDSPWLVGITFCPCGGKLYSNRQTAKGITYEYLRCVRRRTRECGGDTNNIRADAIEDAIDRWMAERGTMPYSELRTIQGVNHEGEIKDVTNAIKELAGKIALADDDDEADREQRQLDSLKARRKVLLLMPSEPDRLVYAKTSRTVAHHWASLTRAEQHTLCVTRGAKFTVIKNGKDVNVQGDPGTLLQGATVPLGAEGLSGLRVDPRHAIPAVP